MPIKITPIRIGRPDYSQIVERIAVPSYKPEQEPFELTWDTTIAPGDSAWKRIIEVPEGKRFVFYDGIVSADTNTLLQVVFSFSPATGPMTELWKWTYQLVHIHTPIGVTLGPGGMLDLTVYNWSSTETVTIFVTVLGMLEVVV
jgi:hypothetical protein